MANYRATGAAPSSSRTNGQQLGGLNSPIGEEDSNRVSLSPPGNRSSGSSSYYSAQETFQGQSIKVIHKIQAKLQVLQADALHSIQMLTTLIQAYLSEIGKEMHALQNTMTDLSLGTEETEPVETYILQFNFRRRNPIKNEEDSIQAVKEYIFKRMLGIEDSQLPKIKSVLKSNFNGVLVVFADSLSKEIVLRRANQRKKGKAREGIIIFDWTR
ncbi:uncharacterized protein LOC131052359 [Cryptomeria japonica]|uniref:uncharacterized protein LOC131052359 n=1 Tax=Cryptomeria japonica TaxID=3369 RepID=UPI0027DA1AD1|nr:uncharacterized protein LOC131052359 [Cryptomeria japonica]